MKKFKHYALLLLVAVMALTTSCGEDYDDTAIKKDIADLQSRVEKLETWCTTMNGQITALQGLVTALEAKDYVTGVSPTAANDGYTITFSKSGAITIYNGKDGANGTDGITPTIGVDKDADGLYYWTIKTGDADADWMKDADGNKIHTTGDTGKTPEISVATDTDGKVYWQVDGKWLLDAAGNKVQATGDTGTSGPAGAAGKDGDSIFKKDGIDLTDPDNVTFTLNDKDGTKITLPRTSAVVIFKEFTDYMVRPTMAKITLDLNIKQGDYTAIKAELTSSKGMTTAIVKATRALAADSPWGVMLTEPTFNADKTIKDNAVVTFDFPANVAEDEFALLKVTVIDATKGQEHAATRVIVYSTKIPVESVTLDNATLDVNVGDEATLTATVAPADASTQTVTWESSDETVATITDGKVKGIKEGTATITVTSTADATKTATCVVTVSNVAVTGITLEDKSIAVGGTVKLVATIEPANATNKEVTWKSSNTSVATIAADGTVEGKTIGEATITVTTKDGNKTTTCKVTVEDKPLIWAEGNLVADGNNGAKIGQPSDIGLYFQFGSLIGWSGTGTAPTIAVRPDAFNGNESWADKGKIWQGTENNVPFTTAGSDDEKAGVGDPCRYYLKGDWRLPTYGEMHMLFFDSAYPNGNWEIEGTFQAGSESYIVHKSSGLKLRASSTRKNDDGTLSGYLGLNAYYWSGAPRLASTANSLFFSKITLTPNQYLERGTGCPVRCVRK